MIALTAALAAEADTQPYVATCLRSGTGCLGHVEFGLDGSLTPRKLPAHALAPAELRIHGKIANENGGHPPALHEAIVDLDSGVAIDTTGLPTCRLPQLERKDVAAARRLCRGAIVGRGLAHIGFASSEAVITSP